MKYNKGSFLVAPNKEHIRGCDPISQVVYFRLCDFSDKEMKCFPSFQTIAKNAGCSRRAVIRAIQDLEKLGVIKKTTRHNDNEQKSNLYHVVILEGPSIVNTPSDCESPPSDCESPPQGLGVTTPVTVSHSELYPINSTHINSTQEVSFIEIWKKYPHARKGKKAEALKYLKLVDESEVDLAIKILNREVKTGAQDPKYIPAMERRARDFVPLNKEVIESKLLSIYKWIRAGENIINDTKQFAEDFGEAKILELYDKIQKENKKLLLSGLK